MDGNWSFSRASFEHGRVTYPLVYTAPAANQGNLPVRFGDAQGAYDAATGLLTLAVPAAAVDGPTAGQTLVGLEARSFLGRNDGLPVNQNLSSDFAVAGPYTLVGGAACAGAPAAPAGLAASTSTVKEIRLTWADRSADEDGFTVERATGSPDAPFAELARVGRDATSFVDRTAARKTTYFYRVRATRGAAVSPYSNVVGAQRKG